MKRLALLVLLLSTGLGSFAQRSENSEKSSYNTVSAGGMILSYFNNSGFYVSAERSLTTYVDLAFRVGITQSDTADGTTILAGIHWITHISQRQSAFVTNESYLGFYPLGYGQFKVSKDMKTTTEQYFYPVSVMGYKLFFRRALVLDMYLGANLAIPLTSESDNLEVGGLMAGIGLGYRF